MKMKQISIAVFVVVESNRQKLARIVQYFTEIQERKSRQILSIQIVHIYIAGKRIIRGMYA